MFKPIIAILLIAFCSSNSLFLRQLTNDVSAVSFSTACSTASTFPASNTITITVDAGTFTTSAATFSATTTTVGTMTYASGTKTLTGTMAATAKGVFTLATLKDTTTVGSEVSYTISAAAKAVTLSWLTALTLDTTNTKDATYDYGKTSPSFTITFNEAIDSGYTPAVTVGTKAATCTGSAKVLTCTIKEADVAVATTAYQVTVMLPCGTTATNALKLTVSKTSSSSSSFVKMSGIALLLFGLLF